MPTAPFKRGLRRIAITTLIVSAIVTLCIGVVVWRRTSGFDRDWSLAVKATSAPIREGLGAYQVAHGSYPETLGPLIPQYLRSVPAPVAHPTGRGGDQWIYSRLPSGECELRVTALHWVSSFDALIWRSSGSYPEGWKTDHTVIGVEDWVYVIGAQRLR